jgi:hypothetical protein
MILVVSGTSINHIVGRVFFKEYWDCIVLGLILRYAFTKIAFLPARECVGNSKRVGVTVGVVLKICCFLEARQYFGAQHHFFEINYENFNHAKEEEGMSFVH